MTTPEPVAVLGQTIARYLDDSFGGHEIDADGDLVVRRGSALTYMRPSEWRDGQTVVRIWSITNLDIQVDGELTRFLATENGKFWFGGFSLLESRGLVSFGHTLLGDFLSRKELAEAVEAVAATAHAYDDLIKARFGGRLFVEPVAPPPSGSPRSGFLRKLAGRLGRGRS